jgi:hypothetical protein
MIDADEPTENMAVLKSSTGRITGYILNYGENVLV